MGKNNQDDEDQKGTRRERGKNWLEECLKKNGIPVKMVKGIFSEKKDKKALLKKTQKIEDPKSKAQKSYMKAENTEKNKTEMPAIQEKVRIALRERNQLECNILALTGGKDGLLSTWDRIILCAKDGDAREFCFYAVTYPLRVKRMKIEFDNLMAHMERNKKYGQYEDKEPLVKSLLIPYENEKECRRLIKTSEELSKRGLLNSEGISEEMLREFYEWSRRYDEKAE